MTTPGTTTTTTDAGTAAASPVLGPDPARPASSNTAATDVGVHDVDDVAAEFGVDLDGPPLPTVAVYEDEDGRQHYASPFSKVTLAHVAAGEWSEVDGSAHPFDPTTKLVREVVAYLEEHAGDAFEVERVKAAEAAGENRPTIAAWFPDGE